MLGTQLVPGYSDFLKPSVIILAFNSVDTLGTTLAQAQEISDDIHVVDSFSTDDTVALSRQYGAQVVQHAFENYGAQRNWAIDNLVLRYPWQLHLDADERLTPELIASMRVAAGEPLPTPAFLSPAWCSFWAGNCAMEACHPPGICGSSATAPAGARSESTTSTST